MTIVTITDQDDNYMTTVLSGQMTRVFRIENKNLKILQSPQNQSGRGRACTHTIQIIQAR